MSFQVQYSHPYSTRPFKSHAFGKGRSLQCKRLHFLLGKILGIFQGWTRSSLIIPYFSYLQRHFPFFLKAVPIVSWCYFHLLQIWVRRKSSQLALLSLRMWQSLRFLTWYMCMCVCSFFNPSKGDNDKISQIEVIILEDIKILF